MESKKRSRKSSLLTWARRSRSSSSSSAAGQISASPPRERDVVAIADCPVGTLASGHQGQLLRPHPVYGNKIFLGMSDELRVAWMVDSFDANDKLS